MAGGPVACWSWRSSPADAGRCPSPDRLAVALPSRRSKWERSTIGVAAGPRWLELAGILGDVDDSPEHPVEYRVVDERRPICHPG